MPSTLPDIAPAFVQMVHRIVWATVLLEGAGDQIMVWREES
jgi:hypothetical protein